MTEHRPGDIDPNRSTLARYQRLEEFSERRLSRLLELVRLGCGVSRALVAVSDEPGGWFSALLSVPSEGANRLQMLCGFAAAREEAFFIEDIWTHPQLAQEKAARDGEGIRFFAAHPLWRSEGQALGVLCLFDPSPRGLSPQESRLLAEFAAEISAHLTNQRELVSLQEKHREHLGRLELFGGVLRAASNIAIIGTDLEGVVRSFHGGAERMLGYRAEEVVGLVSLLVFHDALELETRQQEEQVPPYERGFRALTARARQGGADEGEWLYHRKDGSLFPAALNITGLRSEEGTLTGFVVIVQDLTEQKRLDQLQSEFLSIVSHELRTPLTSIRGGLRLLLGGVYGPIPPKMSELLSIADSNSDRLLRLINDILDFEKLASGTLEFFFEPCEVGSLVEKALVENRAYGEGYGVSFVRVGSVAPAWVNGDGDRISQVLANLLSNAAKFSPRGSTVEVGVDASARELRVWVKDQGSGIPESFRPYVFQRFMQASPADHRHRGGTGLGLSIVRSIIERHGGRVGFETKPGRGTTFYFFLPRCAAPA
jgi:PAS domain S-box-containing protein